ncbi:MAG: trigger factor [Candidatus Neomarinimicrobiota bacterium]|nr:MAG: trigger factor [Candidatus Neomarinimicrobiota bacterium]
MKIDLKEISSNEREMEFELSWEDIEKDYSKFAKKFAKDITLPGFRKGMVPMSILEKKFGPQIDYDFINDKFSNYYGSVLNEKNLNPVSQPELIDLDFKKGTPLKLKVKFEVMPEWDMPKYQDGFPLEQNNYVIEEEDIDESLQRLQENAAEVKVVEDGAKSGHHLLADVQELGHEGEVLNESKDSQIVLGKDPFDGDVEKELLGAKAGDVKTIKLHAGGDHDHEHEFKLTIKSVEEHVLLELNDEFAQTVEPDIENLKALKDKIREELETYWERQADSRLEEQIADYFINEMKDVKLPKTVVEEQAKNIYEDIKKRYPSEQTMDEKAVLENYSDSAEKSLKWQLVKNKIIKDNEIKVEDEDIDARIKEMLKDVKEELRDSYEKYYQSPQIKDQLHDDVMNIKVMDHIKSFAKIKVKKVTRKARLKEMAQ